MVERSTSFGMAYFWDGAWSLKLGENGGVGSRNGFRGAELVVGHSEELGYDADAGFFDFDSGRERAVGGVESDIFDGFDLGCGPAAGLGLRWIWTPRGADRCGGGLRRWRTGWRVVWRQ